MPLAALRPHARRSSRRTSSLQEAGEGQLSAASLLGCQPHLSWQLPRRFWLPLGKERRKLLGPPLQSEGRHFYPS